MPCCRSRGSLPAPPALAISFGVIFVAELGDKSQLMALAFATRYRAATVLIGITIAPALVHLVSVGVGVGLCTALPTGWIGPAAGVAFLGFGAWTLRGDKLTDEEKARAGDRPVDLTRLASFLTAAPPDPLESDRMPVTRWLR